MPRQPRSDAPGVAHHVWSRGVEGRSLFLDDGDRWDWIERLSRVLPESGMRCFAWVLMSNHLHMVVQTGSVPLSRVFKRVNTGFAVRFNRRSQRVGYLFQSRFGSRPVKDDDDLRVVIAYVLRNPLEAGIVPGVEPLARYPWSSYPALVGRRRPFPFEDVRSTLACFGRDPGSARRSLRDWIGRKPGAEPAESSFDALVRAVCRERGVSEAELRAGRRLHAISRARAEVCRRAVDHLALRPADVARALGVSPSAVTQARKKVKG